MRHAKTFRDKDYVVDNNGDIFICVGNTNSFPLRTLLVYSKKLPKICDRGKGYGKVLSLIKSNRNERTKDSYEKYVNHIKKYFYDYYMPHKFIGDVCALEEKSIKKHFSPKKHLKKITSENIEVEKIVEDIEKLTGVKRSSMGIIGSYLFSLTKISSDIDMVVYGKNFVPQVIRILKKGEKSINIRKRKVSFHFSLEPSEDEIIPDEDVLEIVAGAKSFSGKISDASLSMFMPARYVLDSGETIISYFIRHRLKFREGDYFQGKGVECRDYLGNKYFFIPTKGCDKYNG
jgi:predicted nucleotidyltransferase